MDGDGKADIIAAYFDNLTLSAFRNISTSNSISFDPKRDFPFSTASTGSGMARLATGHLDGDGKPDVVVVGGNTIIFVLKNTSSGTTINFAPKFDVSAGTNAPLADVEVVDLNADGKPDIVVTTTAVVCQKTSFLYAIPAQSKI